MSIEEEAKAEAEKRFPALYVKRYFEQGYIAGASRQSSTSDYWCSQEPHPGQEFYGDGGCAECGFNPEDAPSDTGEVFAILDELNASNQIGYDDYSRLHDAVSRASQPVQVEVTEASVTVLAKYMANVASDWNHNDCGDDDHPLEHSNWEAYTDDARRALVAALGGGDRE